ncbi:hypothetical protein G6L37_04910 [Agrobacterium rubi]|nr:hypothetical protein [Agrobacterium rubi]NTF24695.1 hypothetical protein [Agrobacterium rubi]
MGIHDFCSRHGFRIDYNGGHFVRGSDDRVLTGFFPTVELLEGAVLPHVDEILMADRVSTPSGQTISRYLANLARAEAEIARNLPGRLEKYEELHPYAGSEIIDEVLTNVRKVIDSAPLHLAEIERCRALAVNAPSRLFLPLGATVRLKSEWNVPDHYARDPGFLSYISSRHVPRPPEGSIGYVTGAAFGNDECGIVVSFPDDFVDGNDKPWSFPVHGCRKVVHISDLEVLELAALPDGTANLSVDGVAPTHVVDYGDDDTSDVVILENGGQKMIFFVGSDFNPLDESVHFFGSMEAALKIHDEIRPIGTPAAAIRS